MVEMIVTCKPSLTAKYGIGGYNKIMTAVGILRESMAGNGVEARIEALSDETGSASSWRFKRRRIHAIVEQHNANSLLIVGGDDIIPFCRVWDDRLPQFVYSDCADWVRTDNGFHYDGPNIGRMPGDSTRSVEVIVNQLLRAAKAHRAGGIILSESPVVFTAQYCEQASVEVFRRWLPPPAANTLHSCPPWGLSPKNCVTKLVRPSNIQPGSFTYFALHGDREGAFWWGEPSCEWPSGFTPVDFSVLSIPLVSISPSRLRSSFRPRGHKSEEDIAS